MARLQRPDRFWVDDKRTAVSRLLGYACLVPSTWSVFFLTGCSGLNDAIGYDPLLGGAPLRPALATTPSSPAPVPVLPPAAANSTLSTATLAAGGPRPAGADGWAREGSTGNNPVPTIAQTAGGTGAMLRPPEPLAEPAPRQQVSPVSSPGSARDSGVMSYEQAQAQLKARGVLWQDLSMVAETGEWKFSCAIPNRQNPAIRRRYEATASDSLAAIRAVLEQLDKDQ